MLEDDGSEISVVTMGQAVDELLADLPKRIPRIEARGNVRIVDGCFIFANGYEIELRTVNSHEGICEWLWHMNEKNWWTPDVQADFMQLLIILLPHPRSAAGARVASD